MSEFVLNLSTHCDNRTVVKADHELLRQWLRVFLRKQLQITVLILVQGWVQRYQAHLGVLNHADLAVWVRSDVVVLVFVPVHDGLVVLGVRLFHFLVEGQELLREILRVLGCVEARVHVGPVDGVAEIGWSVHVGLGVPAHLDFLLVHDDLVLFARVQTPHLIEGLQPEFHQILRQLADFQIAWLVFI